MNVEKFDEFCLQKAIDYVLVYYPGETELEEIIDMIDRGDMEDIEVNQDYAEYGHKIVVNIIYEKQRTFARMIKEWENAQ